jgi:predicted O-linked N-acetylglucosamine transferase (SPINDLY family)
MDYLISDRYETPEGDDRFCSEKIVRMPHDYVCYEPVSYAPPVGPAPMIANGYPTFGCCNNISKITPEVVALWSEILHAVPDARLLLITSSLDDDYTKSRYREMFARYDTDGRVAFFGRQSHRDLLGRYNEIDIALDPFPYSGGLTTIESLWMGVPVITIGGDRFASRHSVSHLSNVGLQELIALSPQEYVEKAVALAKDRMRLETMRNGLRGKMRQSPLCDGKGFTVALEEVYRNIWREWCASSSPDGVATAGGN